MSAHLDGLSLTLEVWCHANGLPFMSADELADDEELSGEQKAWLAAFIIVWDGVHGIR